MGFRDARIGLKVAMSKKSSVTFIHVAVAAAIIACLFVGIRFGYVFGLDYFAPPKP